MKNKTCSPKPVASEALDIQAYATAHGMNVVAHSSGLYYEILNPGTGATATLNSKIVITYVGELLDGTVFDERTTPNNSTVQPPDENSPWDLNRLIEAWKIGIPLIKEGGHIRLLVPSAMAYGCTGWGGIGPDEILFFDINLVDVQ
jgi:FKBP-type peptidyl-prolyl cis-trans isomerase FkpA